MTGNLDPVATHTIAQLLAEIRQLIAILKEFNLPVPERVSEDMLRLEKELKARAEDAKSLKVVRLRERINRIKERTNPEEVLQELEAEMEELKKS